MGYLLRLQQAQTRKDLAAILGVQASALSFILYEIPESEKYHTFEIRNEMAVCEKYMHLNHG